MRKARDYSNEKEFTLEIIAHYPSEKKKGEGTFHVYWEDKDLDLRGIFYNLQTGKLPWIRFPSQKGILNGETCFFPVYSFPDVRKSQRFLTAIREAFKLYAKEEKLS